MTDEHTTDYLTMEQHQRQEALETAKTVLASASPFGGRVVPEHRTTGDLTDLANFILEGTDPLAAWVGMNQHLATAPDLTPPQESMAHRLWEFAQTVLATGGAVEVYGLKISRADDALDGDRWTATERFLAEVQAERYRQEDHLGYGVSHDNGHTGDQWANLVTDYMAKALDNADMAPSRNRLAQAAALIAAWAEADERREARAEHPSNGEPEPIRHALAHAGAVWCGLLEQDDRVEATTDDWDSTTCPDCQQAAPRPTRIQRGWSEPESDEPEAEGAE